jgi:hypothetical protein
MEEEIQTYIKTHQRKWEDVTFASIFTPIKDASSGETYKYRIVDTLLNQKQIRVQMQRN